MNVQSPQWAFCFPRARHWLCVGLSAVYAPGRSLPQSLLDLLRELQNSRSARES